mgnify:CR=1 FL=1
MTGDDPRHRLIDEWLVAAAEGRAAPEQGDVVNRLLAEDQALRRYVAQRLIDEALIREELQVAEAESLLGEHAAVPAAPSPRRARVTARALAPVAAACAAVAACVLLWPRGDTVAPVPPAPDGLPPAVDTRAYAVVTHAVNIDWPPGAEPVQPGDRIAERNLRIAGGFLQIEFFGGATAVVEGPAEVEVASESRVRCREGKVRVGVPPQAGGFTLQAGSVELVDPGADLGVRVDRDGAGEVHALSGRVGVRQGGAVRLIESGTAVGFSAAGNVTGVAPGPGGFVGLERLRAIKAESAAARYGRWREHSDRWSRDAALAMYFTFDGQAEFDRGLVGRVAGARADGAIVGCRWAQGRFPGKGALEFKQTSDRVRVRVDGEFESVSLFAWLRVDGVERRYNSLLLADAYTPGRVHWQLTEAGALRFSVSGTGGCEAQRVVTMASLGRWVQLATVYDHPAQVVRHYVDGREVAACAFAAVAPLLIGPAELGNWSPTRSAAADPIRSLNGTVDEVAVFRRPLSAEEVRQAYRAGRP